MSFKAVILMFLTKAVVVASMCNFMSITECNQYTLVNSFKFHAFVPRNQWKEKCANMRIVLDCIYQPKYMDGCTIAETFFYDMQRDVSNAVCHDGRYMNHVGCLGNAEMENKVMVDCMEPLLDPDLTCEVLKSIPTCVSNLILNDCGQSDSKYVDTLTYAFLKSFGQSISCELAEPEGYMMTSSEAMTTKSSVTDMMTSSEAMTTKSSDMTSITSTTINNTTDPTVPGAGSVLIAPTSLIAIIFVKFAFSINSVLFF